MSSMSQPITSGSSEAARPATLRRLSDAQLVAHADRAVSREHRSGVDLLDALAEIDRRSLYLDRGYSSLFDYCTRRWRYSPATAARYIAAARAATRFPVVRALLEERRLTICGLARLARHLTDATAGDLLQRASGRTFAEIEVLVAARTAAPRIPDRVRAIGTASASRAPRAADSCAAVSPAVASPAADARAALSPPPDSRPAESPSPDSRAADSPAADARAEVPASPASPAADSPATRHSPASDGNIQRGCPQTETAQSSELRYEIRFAARPGFVAKLERARAICAARSDLETVLERALDEFLDRRDPERRSARRTQRQAETGGPATAIPSAAVPTEPSTELPAAAAPGIGTSAARSRARSGPSGTRRRTRSRHVPAAVRDAVFLRDGGQCTHTAPDGVRCAARAFLQYDHVVPFARGGATHRREPAPALWTSQSTSPVTSPGPPWPPARADDRPAAPADGPTPCARRRRPGCPGRP